MRDERAWRAIAERALPELGLAGAALTRLRFAEQLTLRANLGDTRRVVRVFDAAADAARADSEAAWREALAADGLAVPRRVGRAMIDGRLVTTDEWIHGELLADREDQVDACRSIGGLMARLHGHAAAWPRPDGFRRPRFEAAMLIDGEAGTASVDQTLALVPDHTDALRDAVAAARADLDRLWSGGDIGLIHADLHPWNVILTPVGEAAAIDFGDCGDGPWTYDAAAAVAFPHAAPLPERRAALLAGYHAAGGDRLDEATLAAGERVRAVSVLLWLGTMTARDEAWRGELERNAAELAAGG